ncbi:DUF6115 domain-containing protein [Butyrivibrio sp. MC2013]|uniref:DUF6115 domain-containing protein n=1 Tax=Butyrivibrio sp. MC2013 TaxID=1280686 RepID=UPI000421ABD5|nr:DUF6115 domain-containing protein [Butyrivibrio sp. MC2013]
MGIGVIILLVAGTILIVLGFILPTGEGPGTNRDVEAAVQRAVKKTVEESQSDIRRRIDDTIEESLLKTERGLDRMTNEKMGAISEYADTVMDDIHKNHDEVMFMYDMLNDKHKDLNDTVDLARKTGEEARKTVLDAELTAREAQRASMMIENDRIMSSGRGINRDSEGIAPPEGDTAAGFYDSATPPMSFHNSAAESFFSVLEQGRKKGRNRSNQENYEKALYRSGIDNYRDNIEDGGSFAPLTQAPRLTGEDLEEKLGRVFGTVPEPRDNMDDLFDVKEIAKSADVASENEESGRSTENIREGQVKISPYDFSEVDHYVRGQKVVPISQAVKPGKIEEEDEQYLQNSTILEMHDQGKSNIAIARELGLGVGEVGLVIELSRKNVRA